MCFDIAAGADALLAFLGGAHPPRLEARVLDQHPGVRMVAEYILTREEPRADDHPAPIMIGKFYADETGSRTYGTMRMLEDALAQAPARPLLAVPRALFYDSGRRFLAQQRVEGTLFPALVQRADYRIHFHQAGRALALLHTQRLPAGRAKLLDDHLDELIHPHPRALCAHLPEHRATVRALLAGMAASEWGWRDAVEVAPLHRDFHLRQLFFGHGRVWLIDWDLFAHGDPALDVGNFLVYLRTHLGEQAKPAGDAFLAGYFTDRPTALAARVPAYMAFTYLRLACKQFRLQGTDWRDRTGEMLHHAERCLAEEIIHARA